LAKGQILSHETGLSSGLCGHANRLLALANAVANHLIGLAKLRLCTLELASSLSHQSLRATEICCARAQRQLLRLSQAANTLSNR
jgi:hypothetical protein